MSEINPYKPPESPAASAATAEAGNFIAAGRAVNVGHGWEWISKGWGLFMRRPWVWVGATFVWWLFTFVAHYVPLLGLVNALIAPVLLGGLMLGAHALHEGGELNFGHLFAGFRKNAGTLILVGVMAFVATLLVGIIAAFTMGLSVFQELAGGNVDIISKASVQILLGILVGLALLIPIAMAYWFAPVLVVLRDMRAGEAMKASFIACLKNIMPFLVYGIVLLVPAILATIPMLKGLPWIVLGPVVFGSIYAAYREIFFPR